MVNPEKIRPIIQQSNTSVENSANLKNEVNEADALFHLLESIHGEGAPNRLVPQKPSEKKQA